MITDRDIRIAVATRGRSADRIAVREVAHGHATKNGRFSLVSQGVGAARLRCCR